MADVIKFWLAKSIAEVLMFFGVIGGLFALCFVAAMIQTYWLKLRRARGKSRNV
jgi:hypothetical protein